MRAGRIGRIVRGNSNICSRRQPETGRVEIEAADCWVTVEGPIIQERSKKCLTLRKPVGKSGIVAQFGQGEEFAVVPSFRIEDIDIHDYVGERTPIGASTPAYNVGHRASR